MPTPIRLDVDPRRVELGAGEGARLHLRVRNTSDVVQHLRVEVGGLPEGARAKSTPETIRLLPAAAAEVAVDVQMPTSGTAEAGLHVLAVLVQSPHRVDVSRCEEVLLDVPARPALALALDPEVVHTRGRARFTAKVTNTGNTPLAPTLTATDPERQVRVSYQPTALPELPIGHSTDVIVSAEAVRPWTGQEKRRPISVTASAEGAEAGSTATIVQSPRLSPAVLRSAGAAIAVMVLAGAFLARSLVAQDDEETTGGGSGNATAESGESPTPSLSPSASTPPTSTPTSSPPTTAAPTTSATATPTTTPTATPTPTPTVVPPPPRMITFEEAANGPGARPVNTELWREQGLLVSGLPSGGSLEAGCEQANRVAAHGSGRAVHLTAAGSEPGQCNDGGLQLRFQDSVAPVTDLILEVTDAGDYLVSVLAGDGRESQRPVSVSSTGLVIPVTAEAGVRTVTLGLDPDGGTRPDRVGLDTVRFTPAPQPAEG